MSAWKAPWQPAVEIVDADATWMAAVRAELGRAPRGAHLSEETWVALARGVPPPDGVEALSHVARCAECREVLRAVRALDEAAAEVVGTPRRRRGGVGWRSGLAAAAAVLVILGAGWMIRRPATPSAAVATAATAPPVAAPAGQLQPSGPPTQTPLQRPEWLRATPPPIALYSPSALAVRGAGRGPLPDALAEALVPWHAGRYAEAAGRLDRLRSTYPDAVEVPFYQGVARLLSGSPHTAVGPLREALDDAPTALRAAAAWYLGLALLDSAQPGAARDAFDEACQAGHARGCEAARFAAAVKEGA